MVQTNTIILIVMNKEAHGFTGSTSFALASKVKDYFQLIKFTLSFMVVFSCVVCYLLAPNIKFDLISVLLLFIAGMLKKIQMH